MRVEGKVAKRGGRYHRGCGEVSQQDIADRLHVDRTTVTKVLNGTDWNLSLELRDKIIQTAKEMGYVHLEMRERGRNRFSVSLPVVFSIVLTDTREEFSKGKGEMVNASVGGCRLKITSISRLEVPLNAFVVKILFLSSDGSASADGVIGELRHLEQRSRLLSELGIEFTSFLENGAVRLHQALPLPDDAPSPVCAKLPEETVRLLSGLPAPVRKRNAGDAQWIRQTLERYVSDLTRREQNIVLAFRRAYLNGWMLLGYSVYYASREFVGLLPQVIGRVKEARATYYPDLPLLVNCPMKAERFWLSRIAYLVRDFNKSERMILVALRRRALEGLDPGRKNRASRVFAAALPGHIESIRASRVEGRNSIS